MKNYLKILLILLLIAPFRVLAQTSDAKSLTLEGNDLARQKNYAGAVEKYKAALAADADYAPGNYQMAFALVMMNKGLDGIPYLQKVLKSTTSSANLVNGAYDLIGSIYDQNHQPQKAIDSYKEGIKANPTYQPLQYNLALAYFRNKQYAEAENIAQQAIKLDSTHATTMRLYALVSFHQNKRAAALLGFCSFLMLEPNTARSTEALGNINNILQGGVLKAEAGVKPAKPDANTLALNKTITTAIAPFATRRYASAGDLLAAQLKAIFTSVGTLSAKQTGNDFFKNYFATYFNQLSQTPHMPAFARLISQTKPESATWIKAHPQEMTDLDNWIKTTKRW